MMRADQLASVRRSVMNAIPVNMLLGFAALVVALRYGHGMIGGIWYAGSSTINLARMALCGARLHRVGGGYTRDARQAVPRAVEAHQRLHLLAAALSGTAWALVPLLCAGYAEPQATFYLVVVCGITAGAVVYGAAQARIPISFIVPALLSVIGCLLYAGGFDRNALAATVALYLVALVRSAWGSEAGFRELSRLKNEATAMARSLGAARDRATEFAQRMHHRANHDALTELLNRAGFMQALEQRVASGAPVCLMLLDLDGFKSVNDLYGHEAGDRVLVEVARRLRQALPDGYAAGRLGGDEFAVVLAPECLTRPVTQLATRLIAAIAIPFPGCAAGSVGVSIGIHGL
ncbi:GGDEF domain-containing protein, partial [Roseomonas sp. NAR14]